VWAEQEADMSKPNTVLVKEMCHSTRIATIIWKDNEYKALVAIPTDDGLVSLRCHLHAVTGIAWQVRLIKNIRDLKEGHTVKGKRL
jgi:hypothetical protein